MHLLTKTNVNIYIKPTPIKHSFKVAEVTVGDLHANIVKLVYFLIRNSIIHMEDDVFDRLVRLYKIPSDRWSQAYVDELAKVVKSFVVINKTVLVRLLGDEVADRGVLDMSILWFLAEFVKQDGLIQIHISNHGFEFITYMELHIQYPKAETLPLDSFVLFGKQQNQFSTSIVNLHYILINRWVNWTQVKDLYESVYRPLLRVMTYSLCPTTGEAHLFSHAEAGLETIRELGKFFLGEGIGVDYREQTIKSMIDSIDKMNYVFQKKYASDNKMTFKGEGCYDAKNLYRRLSPESAVVHLVWRRHDPQDPICSPGRIEYGGVDCNLFSQGTYRDVKWFHGHDHEAQNTEYSFTLDCDSGKIAGESSEEEYIDLVSDHLPQAMMIYDLEIVPKLQKLLSDVPQDAKQDLEGRLDELRCLFFRFIVTVTDLQAHQRTAFEEEKEKLVKEIVDLSPDLTSVDSILREESILDYLDAPLQAIFLRNKRDVLSPKRTISEGFFVVPSPEESQPYDETRCAIA